MRRSFRGVRWLEEKAPGSYAARNRGLEEARGEVLAFTSRPAYDPNAFAAGIERSEQPHAPRLDRLVEARRDRDRLRRLHRPAGRLRRRERAPFRSRAALTREREAAHEHPQEFSRLEIGNQPNQGFLQACHLDKGGATYCRFSAQAEKRS